jgi:hypothetical protein
MSTIFLFTLFIALFIGLIESNCSSGSVYSSISNKCYAYISQSLDWNTANQQCSQLFGDNSHLTNSDSAFINAYLAGTNSLVSFGYFVFDIDQSRIYYTNYTADVWIGANDLQDRVNWRWTDGTPVIYNQWQSGI